MEDESLENELGQVKDTVSQVTKTLVYTTENFRQQMITNDKTLLLIAESFRSLLSLILANDMHSMRLSRDLTLSMLTQVTDIESFKKRKKLLDKSYNKLESKYNELNTKLTVNRNLDTGELIEYLNGAASLIKPYLEAKIIFLTEYRKVADNFPIKMAE